MINAGALAVMAATLANGGTSPLAGKETLDAVPV